MIDIIHLVIPAAILLAPMLAGVFKEYFASNLMRVILNFIAPTSSTLLAVYFLDILLINTGIVIELAASSDIWYICGLAVYGILLWYGFFRLVEFGSQIAYTNNVGLQNNTKKGLELSGSIIGPLFESFEEKSNQNINQILKQRNDEILDRIGEINAINVNLMTKCNATLELVIKQTKKSDNFSDRQSKIDSILQQVEQYFAKIPKLYEILLSQIETIKAQQDDTSVIHETSKTVLTAEDGRANRIIGHQQQDEMAQSLRDVGFKINVGHGTGTPDYIIKDRNDIAIIAIGSNKSYTLHDEPKKMQRRITVKNCQPELILAKKLEIPMVIFVTNRTNNRRWMRIVSSSDLESWNGESTPVSLVKDDDDSGQILKEKFCSNIVSLGGDA